MKSRGVHLPGIVRVTPPRGGSLLSFQRSVDRGEVGIERGAQTIHRRDDCERDPGRNQTIFNRGSPRLIRQKLQEATSQLRLLDQDESAPFDAPVDLRRAL